MRIPKAIVFLLIISALGCSAERQDVSSSYPAAVDLEKVGTYPMLAKSGGGYFYDQVLEYRVWRDQEGGDIYKAFATYNEAAEYASQYEDADDPLVLVLQLEHINEPAPGKYEHVVGERIAEWKVEWLEGNKRTPDAIAKFLRAHQ